MKIYTDAVGAPNPKKLRVHCAEKGLAIPMETVDILTGQNRTPEFGKKNPMMGLPVLELDRLCELDAMACVAQVFQNTSPFFAGLEIDPKFANLHRWYADFQKRPSAGA